MKDKLINTPEVFSLAGKTILVTGASSGIGRQIALSCAKFGASIIAAGRDVIRLEALLTELNGLGHRYVAGDLREDAAVKTLAEQSGKVDGVVHSAGISALAPMRQVSRKHLEMQLAINLVCPTLLTQQLLVRNAVLAGGSLLFISSISAHIGVHGVSAYAASKAGLEAMTRSLALEVTKKRIRVNCLAPGLVETPMLEAALATTGGLDDTRAKYPLGFGKPEDVAYATVFFLSDASRWITGTTLILDGGHSIG